MPEIHKVTYIFEGRSHGWTESHWFNSAGGIHAETMVQAHNIARFRAELLGQECHIKATRVSTDGPDPAGFPSERPFRPSFPVVAGQAIGETSAHQDTALLVRLMSETKKYKKPVYLRGIWDSIESNHGVYVGRTIKEWQDRFNAWATLLVRNQWGYMRINERTKRQITNIAADAAGFVTFTFKAGMFTGIAADTKMEIRISGVNNGQSLLNRTHIVSVTDATHATTVVPKAIGPVNSGGFGLRTTKIFEPYWNYEDARIVTRETGAPLLESPGRRSARPQA